jgi:hypothetical protein
MIKRRYAGSGGQIRDQEEICMIKRRYAGQEEICRIKRTDA